MPVTPRANASSILARLVLFGLLLVTLASCGPGIGVRRISDTEWFIRENRSALDSEYASERTQRFLRQLALDRKFKKDRKATFLEIHAMLLSKRDRDIAFHLSELAFLEGGRCSHSRAEKTGYYLASAEYAWAFLFDEELGSPPNPYDSTFRLACNFYNRAIGKLVEDHDPTESPFTERIGSVEWLTGGSDVRRSVLELPFPPHSFDEFFPAYRFEVTGLSNPARTFGLGTPCLAGYSPQKRDELPDEDRFMPEFTQTLPVTTILRFEGSIVERGTNGGNRSVAVEFYDSYNRSTIDVNEQVVELEADLTTPFAYMISRAPKTSGFKAMLDPEAYVKTAGLHMIRPFDPDRIPLILVHGLMSSPMTWVPMVSELISDPVIRENYQLWFFQYPTGFPIPYSASLLRASLQAIADTFDPEGTNPKLQNSVIVGHSMGGLLSKMMILSSGDRLWDSLTDAPFDSVELSDEQRELIETSIFFERLPFITRAVFMSTPHRGSTLATNWIGRLGQSLTTVPQEISNVTTGLRGALTGSEYGIRYGGALSGKVTGIRNLSPKNGVLLEMDKWEYPEDLPYHSIIGNHLKAGVGEGGTDTIVPYWSSHIEGVESELIIKSKHDSQKHQEAILEVYRILLLHLQEKGMIGEASNPTP